MKFLASSVIFFFLWLPMFFLGLPVTFILLCTKWDGRTGWFGNYLYGRNGNSHTPVDPNLFEQWNFLALRNPISNFGKFTLARKNGWLEQRFGMLYGWKNLDPRIPTGKRAFVFRVNR